MEDANNTSLTHLHEAKRFSFYFDSIKTVRWHDKEMAGDVFVSLFFNDLELEMETFQEVYMYMS